MPLCTALLVLWALRPAGHEASTCCRSTHAKLHPQHSHSACLCLDRRRFFLRLIVYLMKDDRVVQLVTNVARHAASSAKQSRVETTAEHLRRALHENGAAWPCYCTGQRVCSREVTASLCWSNFHMRSYHTRSWRSCGKVGHAEKRRAWHSKPLRRTDDGQLRLYRAPCGSLGCAAGSTCPP
jgi:hypothetical protein